MTTFSAQKVFNAIYGQSNPDKGKSLQGWQKRCQALRGAILELKREHKEAAAPFYDTFLPAVADQKARELWGDGNAVIAKRVDELRQDLQEILDGKRGQFERIALSAPSAEQLRLLQTVSLRDDLTEMEVSSIGAKMVDNFQAMRALRSVAKKSNIFMLAPPSLEDFEKSMGDAERFCDEMLRKIDAPDSEMGYGEKCFFEYDGAGLPAVLFERLDNCQYAAVQLEDKPEAPADE